MHAATAISDVRLGAPPIWQIALKARPTWSFRLDVRNRKLHVLQATLLTAIAFSAERADAQELRYHLDASSARPAGGTQGSEFGFGAGGEAAIELAVTRAVGLQMEVGGLWLSHAAPSSTQAVQSKKDGEVFGEMGGVRFHASRTAGFWGDANIGVVETGPLVRPVVAAHIGFDVRVGGDESRWDVGPFVGYEQIIEPADAAFPGDAHIFLFGAHIAIGAPAPRASKPAGLELAKAAPEEPLAAVVPPPAAPPVLTDLDADGVLDLRDACPTIPGIVTDDVETNGCPEAANGISVQRDEIILDDRIYFDTDRARIKHVSWPLVGALAGFIKSHPELERVSIEGHADEVGDDSYNSALSEARAESVKSMLVHRFHVPESVVALKAWGESRPLDHGHSERAHEKNRRVEFVVTRVRNVESPAAAAPSPPSGSPASSLASFAVAPR